MSARAFRTLVNPLKHPWSLPGDTQLLKQGLERAGSPGEGLGPAEPAVAAGAGQVRFQRHEALEARVPQRGQRLADLPVALARWHHLTGSRDGVLDLQINQGRTELVVSVGERPHAALDEVRRVERRLQGGG